ncbi:MAG TPA: hypothetical protein VEH86_05640 [Candidatus Acidoferrum sp.]|nr:hypothetical protein [Candidatus Acidoferrum sp.]
MTGATVDHLVSLIVLLGAILLFIGLFNQTIQTAVIYQQHRYLADKCSDLLDNMLLNPGDSNGTMFWGESNSTPTSFGLQDPEFTQYELSSFSLMRLDYSPGNPVYYPETTMSYSNNTLGPGASLLVPFNEVINYSTVQTLLGINGTFGFTLTISPIVAVNVIETQLNPLSVTVTVSGNGYPLANANVSYCFINVVDQSQYPSYNISGGFSVTNNAGQTFLSFPGFDGTQASYAIIVYASLSGLVGSGYYQHVSYKDNYVVPLIADFSNDSVILAHSSDIYSGNNPAPIGFNATFVLLTQDFSLRQMPLSNASGSISAGTYDNIAIPTNNTGIAVIAYEKDPGDAGIALMPWGLSSLSFPVVFGGNPLTNEWVATDIREATVNGVAYQVKLALWSLTGYQVVS